MLAALYARVSTQRQENEQSIKSQIMAIRDKANAEGYTIVKEYLDDGWTGTRIDRPQLDEMRLDAETASWEVVLSYDPDRIARKYSYQSLISDELEEKGKKLIFVTVPPAHNPEDQLLYGVKGLFAEYERYRSAERFRLGKLRKAREGYVVTSQAPFGYKYIPKQGNQHGYYQIDESEAQIVKMIFDWVGNHGMTIRGVMSELKRLRITPRFSKRGVWASSTLTTMLHNETYIGLAYFNRSMAIVPIKPLIEKKYKRISKTSRKLRSPEKWIRIEVPAIIDKELFDRAQRQLQKNSQLAPRNRRKNSYLLSGMIHCPCGCTRQGEGPQNGKHLYYRCTNRQKMFPLERTCFERGVNARILDKKVWQKLKELLVSPQLIEQQLDRWMTKKKQNIEVAGNTSSALHHQLEEILKQEKKYIVAFGQNLIDEVQLKPVMEELRLKRTVIEKQISRLDQTQQESDVIIPSSDLVESYVIGMQKLLDNADFSLKRNIIEKSVDRIVATQEKAIVSGCVPIEKEYANVKFKPISRNRRPTKCR